MMATRNWLLDFEFAPGAVRVKKTGAVVRVDWSIVQEVAAWFQFFFAIRAHAKPAEAFTIAFTPDRARPWYLIWPVLKLAGGRIVEDAAGADVVFQFDDATESPAVSPVTRPDAQRLNFACLSVSKSTVAAGFEAAFGYQLAIDPRTHQGPAVEKSELNGVHDGRIVSCPMEPKPGRVYQVLIENQAEDGLMEDLRTLTLGGRAIVTFIKRRVRGERFTNHNAACVLADPATLFSAEEQAKIAAFTRAIGMDWGGLDILRDARDGRLYIVDANKTDMGPPISLPLADKLKAVRTIAEAFRAFVGKPMGA
jgi:hypothetical protein